MSGEGGGGGNSKGGKLSTSAGDGDSLNATAGRNDNRGSRGGRDEDSRREKGQEEEELEELDVSGIVRVDLDEDRRSSRSTMGKGVAKQHHRPSSSSPKNISPNKAVASSSSAVDRDRSTSPKSSRWGVSAAGSGSSTSSTSSTVPATVDTAAVAAMVTGTVGSPANSFRLSRDRSATKPTATTSPASMVVRGEESGNSGSVTGGGHHTLVRDRSQMYSTQQQQQQQQQQSHSQQPQQQQQDQKFLQQIQADKDQLEQRLLQEVEQLKAKLLNPALSSAHPAAGATAQGISSSGESTIPKDVAQQQQQQPYAIPTTGILVPEDREQFRLLQENNVKYVQEVIDQKRLIVHLESEIARLKDEANITALRNQEALLRQKHDYGVQIEDLKNRHAMETESLQRRQEDSLQSLKLLHENEIVSIKERYRSEEKFEQIAGQLRTTSGSIQFIEEQLQTRQRGVEAMREGQIDAREKLLAEMEAKARERAEVAEAEGYRLKGILAHMEHMVSSLKEQSSEEKARLKQEHLRLQSQLSNIENEKNALQTRSMEELAYIKQRSREVELDLIKLNQEKQTHFETLAAAERKLDVDQTEFASMAAAKQRQLDNMEQKLKSEEERIKRFRDEVFSDKQALEERRVGALREIEDAEELKNILVRAQQDHEVEKRELQEISQTYKVASEDLSIREQSLQEQDQALQAKETALREGFAQMKSAAMELSQREGELQDALRMMEQKRAAVGRADRELLDRRLESAATFREWSACFGAATTVNPTPPLLSYDPNLAMNASASSAKAGGTPAGIGSSAEDIFHKYDLRDPESSQQYYEYNGSGAADEGLQPQQHTGAATATATATSSLPPAPSTFRGGMLHRDLPRAPHDGMMHHYTGSTTTSSHAQPGSFGGALGTSGTAGRTNPTTGTAGAAGAGGLGAMSAGSNENAYASRIPSKFLQRVPAPQQQSWLASFQNKLQKAYVNGSHDTSSRSQDFGGSFSGGDGGGGGGDARLPAEVRQAHMVLRQSKDHLSRLHSVALGSNNNATHHNSSGEDREFLRVLQEKRKMSTPVEM